MGEIIFQKDRKLDIIAIGRIGVDLNPNEFNRPLEETESFTRTVGGSPANIAVATSKYGMKTGFIGKIADDSFGKYIVNYFKSKNINTDGLIVDKNNYKTGLAFVEIKSPQESNVIMYRSDAVALALLIYSSETSFILSFKSTASDLYIITLLS